LPIRTKINVCSVVFSCGECSSSTLDRTSSSSCSCPECLLSLPTSDLGLEDAGDCDLFVFEDDFERLSEAEYQVGAREEPTYMSACTCACLCVCVCVCVDMSMCLLNFKCAGNNGVGRFKGGRTEGQW